MKTRLPLARMETVIDKMEGMEKGDVKVEGQKKRDGETTKSEGREEKVLPCRHFELRSLLFCYMDLLLRRHL